MYLISDRSLLTELPMPLHVRRLHCSNPSPIGDPDSGKRAAFRLARLAAVLEMLGSHRGRLQQANGLHEVGRCCRRIRTS